MNGILLSVVIGCVSWVSFHFSVVSSHCSPCLVGGGPLDNMSERFEGSLRVPEEPFHFPKVHSKPSTQHGKHATTQETASARRQPNCPLTSIDHIVLQYPYKARATRAAERNCVLLCSDVSEHIVRLSHVSEARVTDLLWLYIAAGGPGCA
ncbi:hypothetical protein BCR44DRAFT_1432645 [Catenaria anguillulae PL171]|uniref:Secreted protein n=1 Tax=Catenaria anguillulae PL171 TaxID=765915 RepID=A0A1Y2HPG1_9FUNG|nr:hypothetical protein BCR44DRAFT_1432645 [Catenaria anguillulae PL171]